MWSQTESICNACLKYVSDIVQHLMCVHASAAHHNCLSQHIGVPEQAPTAIIITIGGSGKLLDNVKVMLRPSFVGAWLRGLVG
jgi:hypothetical protein